MANKALDMSRTHELNPYRPPSAETGFRVKKWKPMYDMVVSGHIMGKSNKELAAEFDVTPVTICNILRSDHAQTLIRTAHDTIRAKAVEMPVEELDIQARIKQKALKRVEEFLDRDELLENSPFAFMDRIAKLTNGGISRDSTPPVTSVNVSVQQNNAQIVENKEIRTESLARIAKALEVTNG